MFADGGFTCGVQVEGDRKHLLLFWILNDAGATIVHLLARLNLFNTHQEISVPQISKDFKDLVGRSLGAKTPKSANQALWIQARKHFGLPLPTIAKGAAPLKSSYPASQSARLISTSPPIDLLT